MIERLQRTIAQPRHAERAIGSWSLRYTVFTEQPERVETEAHSLLAHCVEATSPHGEIFRCGFDEARAAVELSLERCGVAQTAEKNLYEYVTHSD